MVQAFANWLTEIKSKGQVTLQQMLGEMAVIRDGITSNTADLTDFKRHSTQVQQQMQAQLTDLREKLTSAFGEITNLVKQKAANDNEWMHHLSGQQQYAARLAADLDQLKRGYASNHDGLQSSLIQLQSAVAVTSAEAQRLTQQNEQIERSAVHSSAESEQTLQQLEQSLVASSAMTRGQFRVVGDELHKLKEQMHEFGRDLGEYKRVSGDVHQKLQNQIWQVADARKKAQDSQAECQKS